MSWVWQKKNKEKDKGLREKWEIWKAYVVSFVRDFVFGVITDHLLLLKFLLRLSRGFSCLCFFNINLVPFCIHYIYLIW